jgi:outer membrane protein OmpA-like peptidoglycan-associated protein
MGLLVRSVIGSSKEIIQNVNLKRGLKAQIVLDNDIEFDDIDKDQVLDRLDLCDNSDEFSGVEVYGCKAVDNFSNSLDILEKITIKKKKSKVKKRKKEKVAKKIKKESKPKKRKVIKKQEVTQEDKTADKVEDIDEEYLKNSFIKENLIQSHHMIGADFDNGLFEADSEDLDNLACVNVPAGYKLDKNGCAVSLVIQVPSNFEKLDSKLPDKINEKIIELAAFLNRNPDLNARIIGFSSKNKHSNKWYNIKLSRLRAERMKNELTKRGVFSFRLVTDGQGFSNPIADNSTKEGREKNRRVEIKFLRK